MCPLFVVYLFISQVFDLKLDEKWKAINQNVVVMFNGATAADTHFNSKWF